MLYPLSYGRKMRGIDLISSVRVPPPGTFLFPVAYFSTLA